MVHAVLALFMGWLGISAGTTALLTVPVSVLNSYLFCSGRPIIVYPLIKSNQPLPESVCVNLPDLVGSSHLSTSHSGRKINAATVAEILVISVKYAKAY